MSASEMTQAEADEVIRQHGEWLASAGAAGKQADFYRRTLKGIQMAKVDLRGANFEQAKLSGVNMAGAKLARATFGGAKVEDAVLTGCDLTDTDLYSCTGITAGALRETDLSAARLPKNLESHAWTAAVKENLDLCNRWVLLLLTFYGYGILSIISTSDAALVTDARASLLPGIDTPVPIVGFYWVFPWVVAGIYIGFQSFFCECLKQLRQLPKRLPDGTAPRDCLSGLLADATAHFKGESWHFSARWLAAQLVGWWLLPVVLVCFWLGYLPRHEFWGSLVHALLVAGATATAVWFFWEMKSGGQAVEGRKVFLLFVLLVLGGLGWALTSHGIDSWARADLEGEVLSARPAGWKRATDGYEDVAGLNLKNADLNRARLAEAFLGRARLTDVSLSGSDLFHCDLGKSDIRRCFFVKAEMKECILSGSEISNTSFEGAEMRKAQMVGVTGVTALDFRGAILSEARFDGSRLTSVRMDGAEFIHAVMIGARLINVVSAEGAQFQGAKLAGATITGNLKGACFDRADFTLADLRGAQFEGADLRKAIFTGAQCAGTDFKDASVDGADFSGVDLSNALNLSREQVAKMITDSGTLLPKGLLSAGEK